MSTFLLGLTGSIGMGKSTTAKFFSKAGVAVWDADAAVHRLYAKGGAGVDPIASVWPEAISSGEVNRQALKSLMVSNPSVLGRLETIIHPLVASDRKSFLRSVRSDIAVFDIPLLFEKGTDAEMDATLLVTAPTALQRARVLSRPGMTETQFEAILARQMPDVEKRKRATHIIETLSLEAAQACVSALIAYIREGHHA